MKGRGISWQRRIYYQELLGVGILSSSGGSELMLWEFVISAPIPSPGMD